jgi:proteasome lid subunit RPN8/RPN11
MLSCQRMSEQRSRERSPTKLKLIIHQELIRELCNLHKESGIEQAGFLLGRISNDEIVAEAMVHRKNISDSSTSFTIDPHAVIEALKLEENRSGMEIIALIHTHPCRPEPSRLDLMGWRMWPIPWVIISSIDCSVKAWCGEDELLIEIRSIRT